MAQNTLTRKRLEKLWEKATDLPGSAPNAGPLTQAIIQEAMDGIEEASAMFTLANDCMAFAAAIGQAKRQFPPAPHPFRNGAMKGDEQMAHTHDFGEGCPDCVSDSLRAQQDAHHLRAINADLLAVLEQVVSDTTAEPSGSGGITGRIFFATYNSARAAIEAAKGEA